MFTDKARPLTTLTEKKSLMEELNLKYLDPTQSHTQFMDTNKYAWVWVLTQLYEHKADGKLITVQHPIIHQSGLFRGSQQKEGNALSLSLSLSLSLYLSIYLSICLSMSMEKFNYYLEDADNT